jgi:hypothetical protein
MFSVLGTMADRRSKHISNSSRKCLFSHMHGNFEWCHESSRNVFWNSNRLEPGENAQKQTTDSLPHYFHFIYISFVICAWVFTYLFLAFFFTPCYSSDMPGEHVRYLISSDIPVSCELAHLRGRCICGTLYEPIILNRSYHTYTLSNIQSFHMQITWKSVQNGKHW